MPNSDLFHQMLRGFPGVLLRLGPDGRVLASNGRLEARLGRELVGEYLETWLSAPGRRALTRLLVARGAPSAVLELGGGTGLLLSAVWEEGGAALWLTEAPPRRDDDPVPALQRLTSKALRTLDRETLLRRLLAPMGSALGADAVSVWIFDADAPVLRRRAKAGVSLPAELPLASPLTQRLLKRPLFGAPPPALAGSGFAAVLSMPLDVGLPLGVVLWGYQEPHEIGERDRQLARLIADYLAVALDRAALCANDTVAHNRSAERRRLREHFVRVLSHDLRNPLSAMLTTMQLIARRSAGGEQERRLLDGARRAGQDIDRMLRDLLDLGSLGAGEPLTIRPRPLDLPELLAATVAAWAPVAGQHDIRVSVSAPAGLPAAQGDHDRLEQLIGHLVDNALLRTPPGGRIELRAELAGDRLHVCVIDSGPGIEPELKPHLLRPFWQEDAAGVPGAGRGLAVAAAIARAHGDELRLEEGEGACFRFSLGLAAGG